MISTYEVFVDMREYNESLSATARMMTARYEVCTESLDEAEGAARYRAKTEYPQASEYDVRFVRICN
ncbi:MAG: hypothetical protein Kow00121_58760 [Elainellaceae cyanobacterium]